MSRVPERLAVALDAPDAVDVELVGGKAATLARLLRAGLPVPDGICLTADAYHLQLDAAGASESARGSEGLPTSTRGGASRSR